MKQWERFCRETLGEKTYEEIKNKPRAAVVTTYKNGLIVEKGHYGHGEKKEQIHAKKLRK